MEERRKAPCEGAERGGAGAGGNPARESSPVALVVVVVHFIVVFD